MNPQLTFVFLDLGRVLFHLQYKETFAKVAAKSKLSDIDLKRVLTCNALNIEFETGAITEEEFFPEMIKQSQFEGERSEFQDIWCNILQPIEENLAFARELSKEYPIGIISNTNEPHIRHMEKKGDLAALTPHRIYSCRVGYMKPRKEIYQAAMDATDMQPEQTVFIDDREDLIEAARGFGMNAFVFPIGADLRSFWYDNVLGTVENIK